MDHRLHDKLIKASAFIEVGRYSYGSPDVRGFLSGGKLRIGSFTSIADGVTILLGGEHFTKWLTTYPLNLLFDDEVDLPWHERTKGDVVIGNDVWIGHGCTILSGVTIGDGAVIGAGSVVASDVAPYSIVAGSPARELRKRFSSGKINHLRSIKWWEWDISRIKRHAATLMSERSPFKLEES